MRDTPPNQLPVTVNEEFAVRVLVSAAVQAGGVPVAAAAQVLAARDGGERRH